METKQPKAKSLERDFYLTLKKYVIDPTLSTDAEKLFMVYVDIMSEQGLYASNSWFRKELGWKERKTTDIISKLLKSKHIMIMRKNKNSPTRRIIKYDEHTIELYENGLFPDKMIIDYEK